MVSPLLSSIENQVDKLANLGILIASLVISVKKMQGVYKQGNVWSIQGESGRISETVWDFTFALSRKSLSVFLYAYLFIAVSFFCSGQISTWYILYLAVENISMHRA